MNTLEVYELCVKLSKRYKNKMHQEDMAQEAYVSCLEYLRDNPEAPPEELYQVAKRRMFDYYNLDLLPVNVPASDAARAIARGKDPKSHSYSEERVDNLKSVLKPELILPEDAHLAGDDNQEEDLYKTQVQDLLGEALKTLPEEIFDILYLRYYEDMTQEEVAKKVGSYQRLISRGEALGLSLLREALCNKV